MPARNPRSDRREVARPHHARHRSNLVLAAVLIAVALSLQPSGTLPVAADTDLATSATLLNPGTPAATAPLPLDDPAPMEALASRVDAADSRVALAAARIEQAQRERSTVEVDVSRLATAITETEARIARLRSEVAEQAVSLYVAPRTDPLEVYGSAGNLDTGVRRQGLVRSVVRDSTRAIDELNGARQDLLALHGELEASRAELARADRDAAAASVDLQRDEAVRLDLATTLAARVANLDQEITGLRGGEGELVRILTAAQLAQEAPDRDGQPDAALAPASGSGEAAQAGFRSPVAGPITSEFGSRWGRAHNGVDLDADTGTAVSAARSGVVVHADWMSGYGLTVVIDHGGGLSTVYAHLSELDVGAGESVAGGQLIGYSGATGNVTGPHLHFETREHGEPVDPRSYLS